MVYFICLIMLIMSINLLVSGTAGQQKRIKNATARNLVNAHEQAQKEIKMEILVRENERRSFTAMVDCPKCGEWNYHWLKGRARIGHITRQCRECGHEWRQQ